jgi:hypothetical protein
MIADKHWLSTFDNLSRISEWFSDFLCRGVTGEGDMKRSLYTDDDEFIRSYRRCFVINGIGMNAWRPDLLDRSIVFDIPVLSERRPETLIEQEWAKALPGILGGIFTALSKSMGVLQDIGGYEQFRMADFARWGAALAQALGFSKEEFLAKYEESVAHKWQDSAEENVLVNRLRYLVESSGGYWEGSASELLKRVTPETGFDKSVPANPRALSSELMRIAPVLRNTGIDIKRSQSREAGTGRKKFVLSKLAAVNVGVNVCDHCEQMEVFDAPRPF